MYKLVNILREIQAPDTDKLTADFIEKAQKKWEDKKENGKDRYNYDRVQYINNTTPVELLCNNLEHRKKQKEKTGHEWFEQTPKGHLAKKNGCPQHEEERIDSLRMTLDQFIKRARDEWKDKYDYSQVRLVNMDTPVKILCNNPEHRKKQKEETGGENGGHEWFEQTPNNHLDGWEGCPQEKVVPTITNGERNIANALKELGYKEGEDYKTEYEILKFVGENNKTVTLRVDFYIPALKTMIEFDGDYHFRPGGHENSEDKFRKQIKYDKMKNEYCKEHGIKLIRIPYNSMKRTQFFTPLKDAIENKKPGELVLIGNYPKAGWNV